MKNKKNKLYLKATLILIWCCLSVSAQQPTHTQPDPGRFRALWWNVENLFDTKHDTLKLDLEFTPEALRHWTYSKYQKKLSQIARVICSAGEWKAPAIVGMAEVENEHVLKDLVYYSPLKELGYQYVMTKSEDLRGIDLALLYQRDEFKIISNRSIPVKRPSVQHHPTRDLFHISGRLLTGDTLDILLAHFPSRASGRQNTEPYRIQAAKQLYHLADSLYAVRQNGHILLMGDLNDYPHNKSIKEVLLQHPTPQEKNGLKHIKLYSMLHQNNQVKNESTCTYKYKGQWGLLDHIFVNETLLNKNSNLYTSDSLASVLNLPFLLVDDDTYGGKCPFRTYSGMRYQGGYSDHLPIYIDIKLKLPEGF